MPIDNNKIMSTYLTVANGTTKERVNSGLYVGDQTGVQSDFRG